MKKPFLIAAHRGTCGGNIPCNTLAAYEAALRDGADVIELDVSRSADGELFCFHPGMEPAMYRDPAPIAALTAKEAAARRLLNPDRADTVYFTPTLDAAMDLLKGRCLVAVDKFWKWIPEIAACIRRHGMTEDVLCKIPDKREYYTACEREAPDLPVLPVIWTEDRSTTAPFSEHIRLTGVEALFRNEEDPIAGEAYVDSMHRRGLLLWVNPIVYNWADVLTAGHTDDASMTGDPDYGWGWLIDRGYDILQTDWTAQLWRYREEKIRVGSR